jgi:nucleotidyltransferase/DNA polymerase involved in DNA repair
MRVACIWFDKSVETNKLAELFLRFSPQICLRHDRGIFVEIGKCRSLYSEDSFRARATVLLRRSGVSAKITIGHGILDSLTQALFQQGTWDELPLIALLELADPFDRDPILRKSVGNLILSFQDLGIKSLGQLKRLPVNELIARFGVVGRHCHSRLTQAENLVWPLWTPEEIIKEKKEFSYFEFYGELDPILFELKNQLDRIFARLFSRRKKVSQLQVIIRCEKVSVNPEYLRKFDFHFFTPQSSVKGTLKIIKERLGRGFERKPVLSPIEGIQTTVIRSVDHDSSQRNIFNNDEEKLEQIHSLHNQLVEMLGKENVFQATLTEDRRPERAWKKKFDSPHTAEKSIPDLSEQIPERKTYLCRYPVKIQVAAGFISIRKKRYRILNWDSQIEKISGGWFEKPFAEIKNTYDRSYYQVEIEGHQRISVFETPDREFFLHGYDG